MAVLANPLRHSDGPLAFAFGALIWIAVSIAMHSFPSTGDASSIWQAVWEKGAPVSARLVGTPLVALIFAEAIGSVFWLDLLYGIAVVIGLPKVFHIASSLRSEYERVSLCPRSCDLRGPSWFVCRDQRTNDYQRGSFSCRFPGFIQL